MRRVIAIDFDGTYSLCPHAWDGALRCLPYPVVCVANREYTLENHAELVRTGLEIVWCGNRHKHDVCKEQGLDVVVVIDDQPEAWRAPKPIFWVRWVGAFKWAWESVFGG